MFADTTGNDFKLYFWAVFRRWQITTTCELPIWLRADTGGLLALDLLCLQ